MIKEKKSLTINKKRILSKYEKEVRRILFEIWRNNQKNSLPNFIPVSYCDVDKKFQTLKVFLLFENSEENLLLISEINKTFSSLLRHELARTNIFSRVPKVLFVIDKEFDYIEKSENLLKEN